MARAWMTGSLLALFAGTMGCGEEIVPGERTEQPLLTVHGSLIGLDQSPVRVGALWAHPLRLADNWPSPRSVATSVVEPTGGFELRLLRPPPAEVILRVPSPHDETQTAFAFAIAEIVAFEDPDGDHTFNVSSLASGSTIMPPDAYRGLASTTLGGHLVVYIEQARSGADNRSVIPELDVVLTQRPGYYLVYVGCRADALTGIAVPVAQSEPAFPLMLIPATAALPEGRNCLRTQLPASVPTPPGPVRAATNQSGPVYPPRSPADRRCCSRRGRGRRAGRSPHRASSIQETS
jgi:hypothetical protein